MRSKILAALRVFPLCALPAIPVLAEDEAAGQDHDPAYIADRIAHEGCASLPDNISRDFRATGNCEQLVDFFRTSVPGGSFTLGNRAVVTRSRSGTIPGTQLPTGGKTLPWPTQVTFDEDYYFHFSLVSGDWVLTAFRSLALPLFVWNICVADLASPELQEEKAEIEAFQSGPMCLNDDQLVDWFADRHETFDGLRDYLLHKVREAGAATTHAKTLRELAETDDHLKTLLADSDVLLIDTERSAGDRAVAFIVDGILDNSIGFMWVADRSYLPPPDPGDVIMLRSLGSGWWLYKTT